MKHKIIFWLDSNFVHFGLANAIEKKYDCELYAIFDITNKPKPFYQKQKIVNFQKSWFYHDFINTKNGEPDYEYLKSFEERYGINLTLLVLAFMLLLALLLGRNKNKEN